MTAEQLVHLITDNFAADEEITFLCCDDQGQGAVCLTDAEISFTPSSSGTKKVIEIL